MNKLKLQKQIKKKFGSMSNFARVVKPSDAIGYRYGLQKLFAKVNPSAKELDTLAKVISRTEAKPSYRAVSKEQIKAFVEAVNEAGGPVKFCIDNPQFEIETVKHIMYKGRRVMGKKLKELFDHFGIK